MPATGNQAPGDPGEKRDPFERYSVITKALAAFIILGGLGLAAFSLIVFWNGGWREDLPSLFAWSGGLVVAGLLLLGLDHLLRSQF